MNSSRIEVTNMRMNTQTSCNFMKHVIETRFVLQKYTKLTKLKLILRLSRKLNSYRSFLLEIGHNLVISKLQFILNTNKKINCLEVCMGFCCTINHHSNDYFFKDGFSLTHIHLDFIATTYLCNNVLVEIIGNWNRSYNLVINYRTRQNQYLTGQTSTDC